MKAPDKIYIQTNAGEAISSKWTTIPFRDFENTEYIRSDSLQQEQQEANEAEKALSLQIQAYLTTASDELYAPGKPLYTKEHHKGIHECMKMWQKLHQYYFSKKQKQPEVELNEETIINEFRVIGDKCFNEGIEGWQREKLIARHFYELGLNARKEETK